MIINHLRNYLLVLTFSCFAITSFSQNEEGALPTDSIPEHVKLYEKAVKLVDSAKYKEAIPMLKKIIKTKPDYWQAFNKLAFVQIQQKDYKDAEKNLIKSEQILPQNFETLKLKGINFFLNNKFKDSKGSFDTAVVVALEEKIDDAELHFYRAQLMFKGKGYKDAIGACDAALEINPKYQEALSLKGEIRFLMKEYNYAVKELTEAIKLCKAEKPDYNAYKIRAKSKFELKDFKGAITDWSVYIEAFPKEEEALISRAASKINLNDNTGAIADLDAAITINKNNAVSYCYRGVAKGGNKAFSEGIKDLDQAIKLKFDYGTAYVNRAAIKMAIKDKQGACDDLAKADGLGNELALQMLEKHCKGMH
ncbi:MAG: tetratricopeptide repeat protein [Bacteroidota bacterium]